MVWDLHGLPNGVFGEGGQGAAAVPGGFGLVFEVVRDWGVSILDLVIFKAGTNGNAQRRGRS